MTHTVKMNINDPTPLFPSLRYGGQRKLRWPKKASENNEHEVHMTPNKYQV